ncbi:hypothetical protein Zmor_027021 [Zophobas morio]|uniref:Zinc metalloproteinase n=2 Tax=Zophobas morio TaxID=2755281 RepID=A0AA38HVU9_9CUCU|nr:hypothetical protein Zmor_027021 [Zophobas morio]
MNQNELWTAIGEEIVNSNLEYERIKFLGFLSCTNYRGENYHENLDYDDVLKITEAYVALGGGGLALFGTACLYAWPETLSQVIQRFEDRTIIDRTKFMDDSCYKGTLGACFSTTLGSVLHELCHTFDLGHTEVGIMGRGFDDIYKDFLCEERLDQSNDLECQKLKEKSGYGSLGKFVRERRKQKGIVNNIFLTKSCVTILAYHRWLNSFQLSDKVVKFDPLTKLVSSTAGLRVIELRDEENGMVLLHWIFDGRILKYSFKLPEEDLQKYGCKYVVFVEDNHGNILKHVNM